MDFKWEYFLQLAEELIQKVDSKDKNVDDNLKQAYLRTSISRTYYAVFNLLRQVYQKNDQKLRDAKWEAHNILIKKLKESKENIELYIGDLLKDIRFRRNKSDYDKDPRSILYRNNTKISINIKSSVITELLKEQAQECLKNAFIIIQELEKLQNLEKSRKKTQN